MAKIEGLTVEIRSDTTQFRKDLKNLRAEAGVLRSHLSKLGKLIEFNPDSTDLLAQKQRLLGQALAQNKVTYEAMLGRANALAMQGDKLTKSQINESKNLLRQMTNNRLEYERLKQQAIQFGSAASTGLLAAQGRAQKLSESLRNISNAALGIGAVTTYVGYRAIEAAASYESAFAGVRKTINATELEYKQLSDQIRAMALEKPISQEDLAYIEELGGQLNIAKEHLTEFTSTIADLNVSTDLGLEDASLQLARFANIANMSQGDFDRLGSVITDLGNNSATTESQIVNMAMRIVGSASNIGMSAPDVMGLAASLSAVGIQAEMGGNAISTIMNRIDRDVALNTDTLSVWAETAGMGVEEFCDVWENDVTRAFQAVITGMGTFKDEGGNLNTLLKEMDISYMRQVDTMQRLSRTGNLLTENMTRANVAWRENTALSREAEQRYSTAESKIQIMKNAIHECGISIGEGILPAFKDVVLAVTDAVKAFSSMDDATKSLIVNFASAAVASGVLLKGFQLSMSAFAKGASVFASLKTALAFYNEEKRIGAALSVAISGAETLEAKVRDANSASKIKDAASSGFCTLAKQALTAATVELSGALVAEKIALFGVVGILGGALLVSIGLVVSKAAEALDGTQRLTSASEEQQRAVSEANAKYQEACATYGEFSVEAGRAKAALDQEQAALAATSETVGQFIDRMQGVIDDHQMFSDSIRESSLSTATEAGEIDLLVSKIEELQNAEGDAASKKAEMDALTLALSERVDGLSLSYDSLTGKLSEVDGEWQKLADTQKRSLMGDVALDNYNKSVEEQIKLEVALEEAEAQLNEERDLSIRKYGQVLGVQVVTTNAQLKEEQIVKDLNNAIQENAKQRDAQKAALRRYQDEQTALKKASEDYAESETKNLAESTRLANELATKYNEIYGTRMSGADVISAANQKEKESAQEAADAYEELKGSIEELQISNETFAAMVSNSGLSIDQLARYMQEAGVSAQDLENAINSMSSKVQNEFGKIESASDVSLQGMIENLKANIDTTQTWANNIQALYGRAANEIEVSFVKHLESLGPEYSNQVQQLVNSTDGKLSELASLWAQAGSVAGQAISSGIASSLSASERIIVDTAANTIGITVQQFEAAAVAMGKSGHDAVVEFARGINGAEPEATGAAERIKQVFQSISEGKLTYEEGMATLADFGNGVKAKTEEIENHIAGFEMSGIDKRLLSFGRDAGAGLSDGLTGAIDFSPALAKANEGANQIIDTTAMALGTHSPSWKTQEMGVGLNQGLFQGLISSASIPIGAVNLVAAQIVQQFQLASQNAALVGANMMTSGLATGLLNGSGLVAAAADTLSKLVADHFSSATGDAVFAGASMSQNFYNGIMSMQGTVVSAADVLSKLVADHFSSATGDAFNAGASMSQHFASGISSGGESAISAARSIANRAVSAFNVSSLSAYISGMQLVNGFIKGMRSREGAAETAAKHIANSAMGALQKAGAQGSPWRNTMPMGKFFVEGFAVGMKNSTHIATDEASDVAKQSIKALSVDDGYEIALKSITGTPQFMPNDFKSTPATTNYVNNYYVNGIELTDPKAISAADDFYTRLNELHALSKV